MRIKHTTKDWICACLAFAVCLTVLIGMTAPLASIDIQQYQIQSFTDTGYDMLIYRSSVLSNMVPTKPLYQVFTAVVSTLCLVVMLIGIISLVILIISFLSGKSARLTKTLHGIVTSGLVACFLYLIAGLILRGLIINAFVSQFQNPDPVTEVLNTRAMLPLIYGAFLSVLYFLLQKALPEQHATPSETDLSPLQNKVLKKIKLLNILCVCLLFVMGIYTICSMAFPLTTCNGTTDTGFGTLDFFSKIGVFFYGNGDMDYHLSNLGNMYLAFGILAIIQMTLGIAMCLTAVIRIFFGSPFNIAKQTILFVTFALVMVGTNILFGYALFVDIRSALRLEDMTELYYISTNIYLAAIPAVIIAAAAITMSALSKKLTRLYEEFCASSENVSERNTLSEEIVAQENPTAEILCNIPQTASDVSMTDFDARKQLQTLRNYRALVPEGLITEDDYRIVLKKLLNLSKEHKTEDRTHA